MTHRSLSEHPEQVEIERARKDLAQRQIAFGEGVRRAEAEHEKAMADYRKRLSRAMGAEELAEIIEPTAPPILRPTTRRDVQRDHDRERHDLDRRELELHARLSTEMGPSITQRKSELRDSAHALVNTIVDELRLLVGELRELRDLEWTLAHAALRKRDRESRRQTSVPLPPPEPVTIAQVLAEIVGDEAPRKRRVRDLLTTRGREQARRLREAEKEGRAAARA